MSGLRVARLPEGDLQRHKENTKSTFLLASANYGVELSRCKAIMLTTVVKKKETISSSSQPVSTWSLATVSQITASSFILEKECCIGILTENMLQLRSKQSYKKMWLIHRTIETNIQ